LQLAVSPPERCRVYGSDPISRKEKIRQE